MNTWRDFSDLVPIDGWATMRTTSISAEGVSTVIVLLLERQDTGEQESFVMSPDVAMRCGYDLLGDATGITEYEIEDEL